MIIYRYFPADRGLAFLQTRRLLFTPPKHFTDISELCPFITKEFSREEYTAHFCSAAYLQPIYAAWRKTGRWTRPYAEFDSLARTDPTIFAEVSARAHRACTVLQQQFKEIMSQHVGISCMSELQTSNLMWAHYAGGHKGICVELELANSNLELIDMKPIAYRNEKIRIPPWFMDLSESERNVYYTQVIFSKGTEWNCEMEFRLAANIEACSTYEENGKVYYYQEIDRRDVVSVILGAESQLEDQVRQIDWVTSIKRCSQEQESFLLTVTT